ncbi:MAG: N-acetylglucosamine-6-phosphate deacetylase [Pirellulales bacterium]
MGRNVFTGREVQLEVAGGRIASVSDLAPGAKDPAALPWLAPGFVDVQSNGYGGQEFSSLDLTPEKVAEIAAKQASFGVTQFCPTVTTASRETILHALAAIAQACRRWPEVDRTVAGIHLEGPYLSPEDGPRGAHPLEHCRPPDWREFCSFQEAAGNRIRIVTLAVEYRESPAFIAQAKAAGVVAAIGHTSADSSQIRAAVDAGAALSTHLGNGAHRALRRHPNYLWDQLAEDRLLASLIVDGHHLPPEVVKTFVRAKTPARCILVSDLSGLAGMPPGRYDTELCELEILPDGRLVIAGQEQLLAGASRPIGYGVANVMRFASVDLPTAVEMASTRPAQLVGLPARRIESGAAADLVLFDLDQGDAPSKLTVRSTLVQGQLTYSA